MKKTWSREEALSIQQTIKKHKVREMKRLRHNRIAPAQSLHSIAYISEKDPVIKCTICSHSAALAVELDRSPSKHTHTHTHKNEIQEHFVRFEKCWSAVGGRVCWGMGGVFQNIGCHKSYFPIICDRRADAEKNISKGLEWASAQGQLDSHLCKGFYKAEAIALLSCWPFFHLHPNPKLQPKCAK